MQPISTRTRQALTLLSALTLATTLTPTRAIAQSYDADGNGRVRVFSFNHRARIGVSVDLKADKEDDRLGARINTVSPDGPADKAGLKAGDIITRFNGTSLAGASGEDDDQSGPGRKLVELAQKLDEGDTVAVEYRRDNDNRKATLVAEELSGLSGMSSDNNFSFSMPKGMEMMRTPMPGGWGRMGPGGDVRVMLDGMSGMRGGLELTELSPELGEYFGAKSGVLVLKTPRDSSLALKAGDVITGIDGRTPTTESQVRRILQSYDGGEIARIEVLRKQKKVTVSWKVPEESTGKLRRTERSRAKVERS